MCCGLVKGKMIRQSYPEVRLMFTQFTCNGRFISHTSYVLVVQKSCLIQTTLLRTKNICCGLVNGGLNDVYSIYLEVL